jgi:hypothetical protein
MNNILNQIKVRKCFSLVFLITIFLIIAARQFDDSRRGGSAYQTADWLINYSGGFVRRGLFGELFLSIPVPGPIGIWLLYLVQLSIYTAILFFGYMMMGRQNFSWLSIAVWLGPAALGFFAWDGGSPFRKEALTYIVLIALVLARETYSSNVRRSITVVAALLFVLAMFSWEASALFIPLITYLVWTNPVWAEKPRERYLYVSVFFLIGFFGALNSVLNHGDSKTAAKICERVRSEGYSGEQLCSGAIDAIGWSSSYTLNLVKISYPLYFGYFFLAPLALAAVFYVLHKSVSYVLTTIVAVSFIPLFLVVNDYGRWISMAVISLAFLSTTLKKLPEVKTSWFPYLTLAYLTFWGLPHWLDPNTAQWPWLGLLSSILGLAQKVIM